MSIRHLPIGEAGPPEPPRIGVVVPATDQVSEVAFAEMLRGHPVSMVVSRVAFENPVVMANLSRMVDDLTRATALLLPEGRIDVVAFSCTSGTVAARSGPGGARHRRREARRPVHHADHRGGGGLPASRRPADRGADPVRRRGERGDPRVPRGGRARRRRVRQLPPPDGAGDRPRPAGGDRRGGPIDHRRPARRRSSSPARGSRGTRPSPRSRRPPAVRSSRATRRRSGKRCR